MVGTPSFLRPYLSIQPMLQSPAKIRSSTLVNFHLPVPPLLVYKIILAILTNNPFCYTFAISHLALLAYNHLNNLPQKYFPLSQPFSQFRQRQGTRELGSLVGSLVRTDIVLISPFVLKIWTVITGFTITDSLSLRLRKLVYCRWDKLSNPHSFRPSTYYHYFHTLLIPL